MVRDRKLGNQFRLLDDDRDGRVRRADLLAAATRVCTAFGVDPGSPAGRLLHDRAGDLFDARFGAAPAGVTEAEFRTGLALSEAEFGRTVRPWAEALVAVLDASGGDELKAPRFRTLLRAWGAAEEDADVAFGQLDLDGGGTICSAELVEALAEFYCSDDPYAPGNWLFGPIEDGHASTARLPYPDPDRLPPEVVQVLRQLPQLNIFRMLAHAETAFPPAMDLGAALLAKLELPGDLRELVVLQVAQALEAPYVWTQHVGAARAEASQRSKIVAVRGGRLDAPSLSETEQACLAFTDELLRRNRASDAAFARLHARLTPRQIVELLLVVGVYTLVSRVTTALALDADTGQGEDLMRFAREH